MSLPSLTVVIPAFNEEDTIEATLAHVFAQADDVTEIIVIDNNSTDRTADLVRGLQSGQPALQLIREERPGVTFARNSGLDAATSEIIARLDADTLAQPGWARAVRTYFATAPDSVAAATGPLLPFDSPFRNAFAASNERLIAKTRAAAEDGLAVTGLTMAPGGNMALRKSAWLAIRQAISDRTDIHDDLDLSLCLRKSKFDIAFVLGMQAETSARRFRTNPAAYWRYTNLLTHTYKAHDMAREARATRLEVWNNRLVHLVTWLPTRAYDPATGRYSLRRVLAPEQDRIGGRVPAPSTT
ncbi:glycosyltransferase family 2 protein [Rhodococcus sp. NPDC058505]|uniref:glycosyltransferase family 2 protein n=1 Tax=Rhodococcus sp. NPDC058505 TaxID=3346531 RepID=UPI003659B4AF